MAAAAALMVEKGLKDWTVGPWKARVNMSVAAIVTRPGRSEVRVARMEGAGDIDLGRADFSRLEEDLNDGWAL